MLRNITWSALQNTAVIIRTMLFVIQGTRILPTQCVYVFHIMCSMLRVPYYSCNKLIIVCPTCYRTRHFLTIVTPVKIL